MLLFFQDNSSFALEQLVVPLEAKQGQTIEVILQSDESSQPSNLSATGSHPQITFNKRSYKMYLQEQNPHSFKTLIVVPALLKPGKYSISCRGIEKQITVVGAGFPVQRIHLPPGKDNFITSPGEEEAVSKAKATESTDKLWQGKFTNPSKARISAKYGLRRIVNGKLLDDYFHSGLDYAGSLGSPVYACGSGKIILAHKGWRLHGNIICIDHGQGVVSFYLHLKDILVKTGESVEQGQQIGKVGQTGRANGPHLHFSIYVKQDAANPSYWFSKAF